MSKKLNIFRKIWGKKKIDNENASKDQPKENDYFHITFDNHENPEASFTFDLGDKHPVFYRLSDVNNTEYNEEEINTRHNEEEVEVIMNPKQRIEPEDVKILFESPQNSIMITKPQVMTWKNKDAYVYKVESGYYKDGKRPDLEFVIYIPIDTAVKWLDNKTEKTPHYNSNPNNDKWLDNKTEESPHYNSNPNNDKWLDNKTEKTPHYNSNPNNDKIEQGISKPSKKELKYGGEEKDESNYAILTWKNDKNDSDKEDKNKSGINNMGESLESDEDQMKRKPKKAKESKVKVVPMTKKKARRVTTIYEEEEDSISLGPLRPRQDKKSVQIVEKKKLSV